MTPPMRWRPETSTGAPASWTPPTAPISTTGGRPATSVDGNEQQHATIAFHRRRVVLSIGMLAGDLPVQVLQPVERFGHGHDLRRPVDLRPLAEEAVVQDAQRGAWI